ncbi:hypothetical protein FACS1894104_1060 [Actinomycetota bacterium]|nr:hypothetical protein FACS1894104_1060 [Actinomycetota bacterium]
MAGIRFNYFDAFASIAEMACKEAAMLTEEIRDFDSKNVIKRLEAMHEYENAADELNHQIFTHIASEFVPPIEREDITSMAQNLDDIVDYIEDVQQRFYMFDVQEMHPSALEMANLIEKSTSKLYEAMQDFGNFKKSKQLDKILIAINDYEEEADRIYLLSIRDLYINHTDDPIYVLAWNNLFTRMEKCVDACEHVADVMSTIILKNT